MVIGLASLVGALLSAFFVHDGPAEVGLPSMREQDGKGSHPTHEGRWYQGLWLVARNRATWPGFFVNMGLGGTYLAFAGLWAVPYLMDVHGMTRARATGHTTVMLVAFAVSSLAIGKLSDALGRRKPLMLGAGLIYVLCWLPLVVGVALPPAASFGLLALMGACATGFTLSWANVKEVNPRPSPAPPWPSSTPASSWAQPSTSRSSDGSWIAAASARPWRFSAHSRSWGSSRPFSCGRPEGDDRLSVGHATRVSPRVQDALHDPVHADAPRGLGEEERPLAAHAARVALHDGQVGADRGGEVGLVDDEEVRLA